MLYKTFDTFVFDYDGTLFDSLNHAITVFKMVGQHAIDVGELEALWSDEFIASVIGHNPLTAWKILLPNANDEVRHNLSTLYSKTMLDHLLSVQTQWYPHAHEVVQTLLNEGKHCVLLTNARRYYVEVALSQHPILKSFKHVVCAQDFNYQSKAMIMSQLPLQGRVMVIGDKMDDALGAQSIDAYSVWASYGYGTYNDDGNKFNTTIKTIADLLKIPSH